MKRSNLVACVVLGMIGPVQQKKDAPKRPVVLKVTLENVAVKAGERRTGTGLAGAIPTTASRAKVKSSTVDFFDMNGDGKLVPGVDGMSLPTTPFVVPIPNVLLLREGQFTAEFDGTRELTLTPDDLGPYEALVSDASILTELRIAAGLSPIAIDSKACDACKKHLDYLIRNGVVGGNVGMSMHVEDTGKPGYSPEGAAAAKVSDFYQPIKDLRSGIDVWSSSVWHRVAIVTPSLKRVGVGIQGGIAMLYPGQFLAVEKEFVNPADGATGVPCAFGMTGEVPIPVPGCRYAEGFGYPIMMLLRDARGTLEQAEVIDDHRRGVVGMISSPGRPATAEWPTNSGCAVFVPAKPLAPATTYHVRFKLEGRPDWIAWSFTTKR